MKDQAITVADALFMAKAELQDFYNTGARDPHGIIERVHDILFDPKVGEAMGILVPALQDEPGPGLVPDVDRALADAHARLYR